LIGQDPYHQACPSDSWIPLSATGLCFSLPRGTEFINPSLASIQKELVREGFNVDPKSGDLSRWAEQGVVLLNSALTVREGCPKKHTKMWAKFTEALIEHISSKHSFVWILWGADAQSYESSISEPERHCIIRTSHPCPLSSNKPCGRNPPFNESGCFKMANSWLKSKGLGEIDWSIL
jgi:uracil-DNA glycosylase